MNDQSDDEEQDIYVYCESAAMSGEDCGGKDEAAGSDLKETPEDDHTSTVNG